MTILFAAVFKPNSTNVWQAKAFEQLGHKVIRFEYRERPHHELLNYKADVLLLSKCNGMDINIIRAFKGIKVLWFMDYLGAFDYELKQKVIHCDLVFTSCDGVLKECLTLNSNSFINYGGYDPNVHKSIDTPKIYDVTFIGTIKGHPMQKIRQEYCEAVGAKVFNGVYGLEHSKIVSQSRINLNFCYPEGTSNRLYKIMAAGGFVLSSWFEGFEKFDKIIDTFSSLSDFVYKIEAYLLSKNITNKKGLEGVEIAKQYDNISFAKRIIEKI
jgi:hypothetical protein